MFVWAFVIIALVFAVWVRLAPSDPARWHVASKGGEDRDGKGFVVRRLRGGAEHFDQLDQLIRNTDRTTVLSGAVDSGMVTYVTRSKLWGFPDYTTVEKRGEDLVIHGRLRFGRSDLGVNRARVEGWISALPEN